MASPQCPLTIGRAGHRPHGSPRRSPSTWNVGRRGVRSKTFSPKCTWTQLSRRHLPRSPSTGLPTVLTARNEMLVTRRCARFHRVLSQSGLHGNWSVGPAEGFKHFQLSDTTCELRDGWPTLLFPRTVSMAPFPRSRLGFQTVFTS